MRIGVDLMGSEVSPAVLFQAALQFAEKLDSGSIVVIGTQAAIQELPPHSCQRLELYPVAEAIGMEEEPIRAIASKTSSSMVVGLTLLRKRKLNALISAGNTGALIAGATLTLRRFPGIQRPALLAWLPTATHSIALLDVGGNVSCKPHHLVQFAIMGSAACQCYRNIECPRVGLLNIGVEPKKGTSVMRQSFEALQKISPERIQFVGNVEGRELFQGAVDVLVSDGFTGNIFLKASEGVSVLIFEQIFSALKKYESESLLKFLEEQQKFFSYKEHPGALVCGVEGIVIKCHGNATVKSILHSIQAAVHLVKSHFLNRIKKHL